MEQFFFKVTSSYAEANKMDEELKKFFISYDATILKSKEEKDQLIELFENKRQELLKKHKRCKEIRMDIWSHSKINEKFRCGCTAGIFYNVKHDQLNS